MDDLILKQISALIATHSGIQIREQDFKTLTDKLWKRTRALGLFSLNSYYQVLMRDLGRSGLEASSGERTEWQELYAILTINESYFFRDKNQYQLLREKILPNIIERNRLAYDINPGPAGSGAKPKLRIWSAGCSTGEELYSIAIVLEELQFPWDQWDVLLIGTDISKPAIDSARKGLYGSWSFRQVPNHIQQKYFLPHHQLFKLSDALRQRVTFQYGNLLQDPFPSQMTRLFDIDLILCRNVFIYLDSQAISQIINKFHQTLVPHGYLITGHTELYAQDTTRFQVLSFPESLAYQKLLSPSSGSRPLSTASPQTAACLLPPKPQAKSTPYRSAKSSTRPPLRPSSRPNVSEARPWNPVNPSLSQPAAPDNRLDQAVQEAEALLRQEAYASAIERAERIYTTYPQCDAAYKIAAHAYANIGGYDRAKQLCQQVLQRQPLNVDMYYLLAQIAEDQNELEITKNYLRKIIYLDSNFVKAYLDLATIYEREKQPEKTQKMQSYALDILGKLPPDTVLDPHSGTTVAQWTEHLKKKLPEPEN